MRPCFSCSSCWIRIISWRVSSTVYPKLGILISLSAWRLCGFKSNVLYDFLQCIDMASKYPGASDVSDQETEDEIQAKGRLILVRMRPKASLVLYNLLSGELEYVWHGKPFRNRQILECCCDFDEMQTGWMDPVWPLLTMSWPLRWRLYSQFRCYPFHLCFSSSAGIHSRWWHSHCFISPNTGISSKEMALKITFSFIDLNQNLNDLLRWTWAQLPIHTHYEQKYIEVIVLPGMMKSDLSPDEDMSVSETDQESFEDVSMDTDSEQDPSAEPSTSRAAIGKEQKVTCLLSLMADVKFHGWTELAQLELTTLTVQTPSLIPVQIHSLPM